LEAREISGFSKRGMAVWNREEDWRSGLAECPSILMGKKSEKLPEENIRA
jgi:hypothetical protein